MKFVFDLDGTICFKGQPVSNNILTALSDLTSQGHEVIFASARPIRDMLPILDKKYHQYTMIGGNGSLISKNGEIIYSKSFTENDLVQLKELIKNYQATYLIDGEWNYAYTGSEDHPILQNLDPAKLAELVSLESLNPIVKVLFLTSNNHENLASDLAELDLFINLHGNENILDISPKGINKWSALKELGINKDDYIAFGNDANDITMFENALHSVMIGHHDELAKLAKESIALEDDYELAIIKKLNDLSNSTNHLQNN